MKRTLVLLAAVAALTLAAQAEDRWMSLGTTVQGRAVSIDTETVTYPTYPNEPTSPN